MDRLPTGVNKIEEPKGEPEPEFVSCESISFVEVLQKAVSSVFAGRDFAKYAAAGAPMVAFACSLYIFFRGITTGTWCWYEYVIHITGMVTQILTVIAAFWIVKNHASIASALVKLCLSALTNITCSMGVVYGLAIKFGAALAAGALVASGFLSSVSKIGSVFSAIKHTRDFLTDIINSVAALVGFDFTDRSELNTTILARTKKLHDYLSMPSSSSTGDKYQEIEAYSQDCRAMVQTNKGIGDTVTLQGLMKLINDVDDRLRSIREEWLSRI